MVDHNGDMAELALEGAAGLTIAYEAGAAMSWNPVGWVILGVAAVGTIGYVGYTLYYNSPSQKLGRSMQNNGMQKPNGPGNWHAHHIIPFAMAMFDQLRKTVEKAGVDLNSYVNGVWLNSSYHLSVHTKEYLALLEKYIKPGMDYNEIVNGLDKIRQLLQNGWTP